MERWLSKSRVLLALSAVLLVAALNRHDPMIYGMFLFLATLSALGLILPWLSLQSMSVSASGNEELVEGQTASMQLVLHRKSWFPVFMVDVETSWKWGKQTVVLAQTLPVVRARGTYNLGSQIRFPCRGDYRLQEVILSSGFPLGLITARHRMAQQGLSVLVRPMAQAVSLPGKLGVSHDPLGNQVTQRIGQSFELGGLRNYVEGEPIGRVNWRASARSGELVIQQFQQSGSPLLHLVTDIPAEDEIARPLAPAEHALRIMVGICEQAQEAGLRVMAYVPGHDEALRDSLAVGRALASAGPGSLPLAEAIRRAGAHMREGANLVAVVSPRTNTENLVRNLSSLPSPSNPVIVYIATQPAHSAGDLALASAMKIALEKAGLQVMHRHPGSART